MSIHIMWNYLFCIMAYDVIGEILLHDIIRGTLAETFICFVHTVFIFCYNINMVLYFNKHAFELTNFDVYDYYLIFSIIMVFRNQTMHLSFI